MLCPRCQFDESKVIESKIVGDNRIRVRMCKQCGLVYTTIETISQYMIYNKQTRHSEYRTLESSLF